MTMADCVDRSYLLDRIRDYIEEYSELDENGYHDFKWCAMKEAEMVIMDAPATDVQSVVCGEWKENVQCSNCGWYMEDDVTLSPMMVFFNYCPNCGAKMDEVS